MRALVIQHEHDGPAGLVGDHLRDRGFDVDVVQVMQAGSTMSDVAFPDPTTYDVIVPLGSVHSVYDQATIGSWVGRELELLRVAHAGDVPVFGICFGAQAIAAALGGSVERAPEHEIGWYHYQCAASFPVAAGPWFSWHDDRCVLPDGAEILAHNDLCPQAFRIGRTVGVQFHPEVTLDLVAAWTSKCSPAYFAQRSTTAEALLDGFERHGSTAARHAGALFDWFLDSVAS
jgi:GMP synthase-like glutamine amidotransferase